MFVVGIGDLAAQGRHDEGDVHHELQVETPGGDVRVDNGFVGKGRLAEGVLLTFPGSLAGVLPAEVEGIGGALAPATR